MDIGYSLALAAGLSSVAIGYAGRRYYRYRRGQQQPQSLGIKVQRLQKQDTKEKKKKEKEKAKQNEYLFDVKQYLASFKEGTPTTTVSGSTGVTDESSNKDRVEHVGGGDTDSVSSSTTTQPRGILGKYEGKKQRSARILLKEFEDIVQSPVENIGLLPEKNNLFLWHCNIIPHIGVNKDAVFHFEIRIPDEYPENAPTSTSLTPGTQHFFPAMRDTDWRSTSTTSAPSLLTEVRRLQTIVHSIGASYVTSTQSVVLPRVHHDATKGIHWPPVTKSSLLGSLIKVEESYADKKKKELVCFYTKQSFEETKLGFGISFNKNIRTGDIQQIRCTQKLVSLKAFNRYKIRLIDNMLCTHWLPVYICSAHAPMRLAERALSLICTGSANSFQPEHVLKVLPKLMNTILVNTATGVIGSAVGLRQYCLIHQLLLAFYERYPTIGNMATRIIREFIEIKEKRHKNVTPALGELVTMLPISDLTWNDLKKAYYEESNIRHAYWIIKAHPTLDPEYRENMRKKRLEELRQMKREQSSATATASVSDWTNDDDDEYLEEEEEWTISDEERIDKSFNATRVGRQILALQIFIQNNIAQPKGITRQQIEKQYEDFFGSPVDYIEKAFMDEVTFLRNFTMDDYLTAIGMPILNDEDLAAQLVEDMRESRAKGYHGEVVIDTIVKAEDFARKNRIDLKQFYVNDRELHSDEEEWKMQAYKRWGLQDTTKYCSSWRETYLCNHLRDVIEGLNDSQDFDHLYDTADRCSNYLSYLEFELFNPTNLKSKYFFLAKLLDKLHNLKTFKLIKGEDPLDDKAFKALCLGLNRCKKLTTLILDHCQITKNTLQHLLSNDLVSDSITSLSLNGNDIGSDGVTVIGKFLSSHKTLPNLEELSLNGCKLSSISVLADSLIFKQHLRSISLRNNHLGAGASYLLNKLAYCPKIEVVDLAGTGAVMDATSLQDMLSMTASLRSLNVYKSSSISMTDNVVNAFKNNTTLTSVDLGCSDTVTFMPHLGRALASNRTLKSLCLRSCKTLKSHVLVQFMDGIRDGGGSISLEELDLSENSLYGNESPEDGINKKYSKTERIQFDVLGDILSSAHSLKVLNLGQCCLHSKSIARLSEVLKSHGSLVSLDLRKNQNIYRTMHQLTNALKENTTLESIDISGSSLGAAGALLVAELLERNTTLKSMSLYGNFIGPDGCCAVFDALSKNEGTRLTHLDIGLNRIKARGVKTITNLLQREDDYRFPMTHLGLKSNHISDVMALRLVSAICQGKSIGRNHIERIALHGNQMRSTTTNQIASDLSLANIEFDLAKLVENKQPEKQERTVYLPSLNLSITVEAIKRMFYRSNCGAIVSVEIYPHKKRGTFSSAKYAFVEFAELDSVNVAMKMAGIRRNRIGSHIIRIYRAGITQ